MTQSVNRHRLTDEQWQMLEPLIPKAKRTGRPPREPREMLEAMIWLLRTGAPWRDLPDWYGPWQTVYSKFCQWREARVLEHVVEVLQVRLADAGKIDWELWCVDGTSVRAERAAHGLDVEVEAPGDLAPGDAVDKGHVANFGPLGQSDHLLGSSRWGWSKRVGRSRRYPPAGTRFRGG